MKVKLYIVAILYFILNVNMSAQKGYAERINQLSEKGQKTGLWKEDTNKYWRTEIYYQNGKKNGLYKSFSIPKGELSYLGEYKNDTISGTWYSFGDFGHLTGEIVLSLENASCQDIALVMHEITHIEQLMNGELWIENGNITGYDINDEVEAYQKQHDATYGSNAGNMDFNGNSYPDGDYRVTPEDIYNNYPGYYDNLPNQDWSKPDNSGTNTGSSSSAS